MRPTSVASALALWAVAACSSPALAADKPAGQPDKMPPPPIEFSLFSRYATDYNFRGISNSDLQPSYQSGFEAAFADKLIYTGFQTFQVRLPTRPDFEFDLLAGIRPKFGKLSLDLGIVYYFYPNERRLVDPTLPPLTDGMITPGYFLTTANIDFYEFAGKASYEVTDALSLGAQVYASSNYIGTHASSTYASGLASYRLPATVFPYLPEKFASGFTVSAELGHLFLGAAHSSATGPFNPILGRFPGLDLPSYTYGNVGVTYARQNIQADLRFHDTDLTPRQCFTLTSDFRGFLNGGTSRWCGAAIIASVTVQASTSSPGWLKDLPNLFNHRD